MHDRPEGDPIATRQPGNGPRTRLVLRTEVTNLPNLAGFLRFGRGLPVIRFDDRYNRTPSSAEAFIERSDPPLRTVSTPSLPAPAAPSKPPATRKRPPKQAAGSAAPELPLGPVATAGDGDKGDGKAPIDPAGGIGGHDPDAPIARLEIIATPWTHSLRQHGRPGGRRSPANPA